MRRRVLVLVSVLALVAACGGARHVGDGDVPVDAGEALPSDDAGDVPEQQDGGADGAPSALPDGGDGAVTVDPADGTPTRVQCTNNYGSALTAAYGRLDGFLVSIVPSGTHRCNGDDKHLHLQIQMNGGIYDVAANLDTLYATRTSAMPAGPWMEGWHPGVTLDYASTLGLHAADFTTTTPDALTAMVQDALKTANHLSVFATGYGPDGVHNVHRTGRGNDGAIVIHPLAAESLIFAFRFVDDRF
jgi:hypothetical protein